MSTCVLVCFAMHIGTACNGFLIAFPYPRFIFLKCYKEEVYKEKDWESLKPRKTQTASKDLMEVLKDSKLFYMGNEFLLDVQVIKNMASGTCIIPHNQTGAPVVACKEGDMIKIFKIIGSEQFLDNENRPTPTIYVQDEKQRRTVEAIA